MRVSVFAQAGGAPARPTLRDFKRLPNGSFQLRSVGEPGRTYSIQASANLTDWATVLLKQTDDGTLEFTDEPANLEKRFYRAAMLPASTVVFTNYHGWSNSIVLSNGKVEAVIVPAVGRIMQFRFAGETGPFWEERSLDGQKSDPNSSAWLNFGGDKSWPAPQSEWSAITGRSWPPPKAFDAMPATASVTNGVVTLISPVDSNYGIRVSRRIGLHAEEPVMSVTTSYEKITGTVSRISVWTITQLNDPVRAFALIPPSTRFPTGYTQQSSERPADLTVTNRLLSLTRDATSGRKIGTDSSTLLWVGASVCLRIDSPRKDGETYPDNGSSAEIYTNPDPQAYVELEMLGPLLTIKAGDRIEHTSKYTLLRRTETTADAEARKILSR